MQQDWNCLKMLNYDSLSYKVQSRVLAIIFSSNMYIIGRSSLQPSVLKAHKNCVLLINCRRKKEILKGKEHLFLSKKDFEGNAPYFKASNSKCTLFPLHALMGYYTGSLKR